MIRNLKLKKFLVNCVFPIFTQVNKIVPKDDSAILIYCANDELNDNSKALYDYLVENRYYDKYTIYCSLKNYKSHTSPQPKKVKFIPQESGIWRYMRSKYMFYSMGKIPIKPTKKQMVINMWHGPVTKVNKDFDNGKEFFFTYVCSTSEMYNPMTARTFGCPEENICICGEPKTDKIFREKESTGEKKFIVWAPTFRQSKYLGHDDSMMKSLLPLIEDSEWEWLNDGLSHLNIRILAKLHPMQDVHDFTERKYSNLEIYSDQAFCAHGYDLYDVLSQSDALISDYSSVFLEYLLLDRPIGFALCDMEEYANTRGFSFDNPLEMMAGKKMYTKEDLMDFLHDVADDVDIYQTERQRVKKLVHKYDDGNNCRRVLGIAGISI